MADGESRWSEGRDGDGQAGVIRLSRANTAEIAALLDHTSRTFALAIPLLPEPTREQVGIAYLLFRIADTFEDAELWPREEKLRALADFDRLLVDGDPAAARARGLAWRAAPPCDHQGYLELLARADEVLGAFEALAEPARSIVRRHTRRTVEGMAGFVRRADAEGHLELRDLADLRAYCYVVAGIVGEMLTELFLDERPDLAPIAPVLSERAARFGEALQLVNIVKDAAADARSGRRFLPAQCDLAEVFTLARRDVEVAVGYTLALQSGGAPRGIVAFTALPIRLARATLDKVEAEGPGARLSREEVAEIRAAIERALDEGRPAV
jgi:farnesyl-diphosphate farnesyltransferase